MSRTTVQYSKGNCGDKKSQSRAADPPGKTMHRIEVSLHLELEATVRSDLVPNRLHVEDRVLVRVGGGRSRGRGRGGSRGGSAFGDLAVERVEDNEDELNLLLSCLAEKGAEAVVVLADAARSEADISIVTRRQSL